jgi:hypothetical protein
MQKLIVDHRPTAIPNIAPVNWEKELPLYRVSRDVHPSPKARARTEPPVSSSSDPDMYQYAERPMKAGEIFEITDWPHPSFRPLNYSAAKVMEFFSRDVKSRMQRSPWVAGRVQLDNGLTGSLTPQTTPPPLQPMDLRPAS